MIHKNFLSILVRILLAQIRCVNYSNFQFLYSTSETTTTETTPAIDKGNERYVSWLSNINYGNSNIYEFIL